MSGEPFVPNSWQAVMPKRKNNMIFDALLDSFQKSMTDLDMVQWLSYNMTEISAATPFEEALKMLQQK